MARELDIKVVVDSAKAKSDLASVDQQIENVGTTATKVSSVAATIATTIATAFTVQELINFGKQLISDADLLTKLSDKTGISTDWLQRFRVAGDDAGVSLESMASAVNQMQNRLLNGDAGLVGAFQRLHINVRTFLDLRPEEQFLLISDAIRNIQNPAEQANLAMQIFGRSGAELLPVLKRGFDDVKDSAAGMSRETVAALDGLGDKLGAFARISKGYLAELTVALAEATNVGGLFFDKLAQEQAQTVMMNVAKTAKELKTYAPIKPIEIPDAGELLRLDQELNNAVKRTNEAAKAAAEHHKALVKVNEEHAKFVASIHELEGAAPKATFRVQTLDQALASLGRTTKVDVKDVRDFQNELRGLYTPLDHVEQDTEDWTWALHQTSDALDDVEKDSKRFGDKMTISFSGLMDSLQNIWHGGWGGLVNIAGQAIGAIVGGFGGFGGGGGMIGQLDAALFEFSSQVLPKWSQNVLNVLGALIGIPGLGSIAEFFAHAYGFGGPDWLTLPWQFRPQMPGGTEGPDAPPPGGGEGGLGGSSFVGGRTVNIYNPTVTSRSAITAMARQVEAAMSDSFRMRGPLSAR